MTEQDPPPSGVDRRSFLRTVAASPVGAPHLGRVLQPVPVRGSRQDRPAPVANTSRQTKGR